MIRGELECAGVDRYVMEADGGNEHANRHADDRHFEDSSSAKSIDETDVEETTDEIGTRDRDANRGGIAEADDLEQSCSTTNTLAKMSD